MNSNKVNTLLVSCSLLALGCNDPSFVERSSKNQPLEQPKVEPEQPKAADVVQEPEESPKMLPGVPLYWLWECQSSVNLALAEQQGSSEKVIRGQGPHFIDIDGVDKIPLVIKGKLCQPSVGQRDIFFAVDVSNSMTGRQGSKPPADPQENGSCGRLNSIDLVLGSLKKDGAKLGLATFNGDLRVSSNGFFVPDQFKSQFVNSNNLCAGDGATNYKAALQEALNQFRKNGRENSLKEMFFISDGRPNSGKEGSVEAKTLRDELKVQIATIYLFSEYDEDDESVLMQSIASTDVNGKPLHRRAEGAQDLITILEQFANATIVKGTFSYKSIGSEQWVTKDLKFNQDDLSFELPLEEIAKSQFMVGIDFKYEYQDSVGRGYSQNGRILWEEGNY